MFWVICLAATSAISIYLLVLLNRELYDRYTWQKEIIYRDYIDSQEIKLITSSSSLTVSSFRKNDDSKKIAYAFDEILNNLSNTSIPFRATISNYVAKFLEDRNVFVSFSTYDDKTIRLFNGEFKLEGPSFFVERNIYNIYVQYNITKNNDSNLLAINSESDYVDFLQDLYQYNNNFTCKVNYSVYKQVGKDEKAEKVSTLSLITKIGPSYSYINYKKPFLINVCNFSDF